MDNPSFSSLRAHIPLPLLKDFLVQAMDRSKSITKSTSLHSNDWEYWDKGLKVWRETLTQLEEPALRLILADRGLWDAALKASPDPSYLTRISDKKSRNQWREIPEQLESERTQWEKTGFIFPKETPPSMQWPALSLVVLARQHGVQWKDAQERFAQAFARSAPRVCETLLEAYPNLDINAMLHQNAKHFLAMTGDDRPLSALLFSDTHREVSELLQRKGLLRSDHVHKAQIQDSTLLHRARTDIEKSKALLNLGADPDALDENGLLADEVKWFSAESPAKFHKLLQSHRGERNAQIARKRVMATALGDTPFSTLSELGFFREATADPIVPSEVGDMGLLSFLHHRFQHSSQRRIATLVHILSGKRRATKVLEAEGSLEEGLATALGLIAREGDLNGRDGAMQKAFERLLEQADPNQVLVLALRKYGQWISGPDPLNTVLSVMGDKVSDRPLLQGMDFKAWEAFRDAQVSFLADRWAPPNGKTAQGRGDQHVWTRTVDAILKSLAHKEEQTPLNDQEKAQWLPSLMTLACGVKEEDHPAYAKVMEWLSSGIDPIWPNPEAEAKVHSWMNWRYPGFEAEVTSKLMEGDLPQAKATVRPGTPRF